MNDEDVVSRAVRRLLALPVRQRQAIVLCTLLGLPEDQAAAELGITRGALGSHLRRALQTIRSPGPEQQDPPAG